AVRLVDDRAIELRRKLLVLPVAIVHPDLDEVDLALGELAHGRAALLLGRDPVWSLGAAGLGHRDAAARGVEPGGGRNVLLANLERDVRILAETCGRADAEPRTRAQVLDQR